jgi:DNA replication protein DnaC
VVTRRYEGTSIILSTNKPFAECPSVFPNAACVVTLVNLLVHRSELTAIEGSSYRLKDATERAAVTAKTRGAKRNV